MGGQTSRQSFVRKQQTTCSSPNLTPLPPLPVVRSISDQKRRSLPILLPAKSTNAVLLGLLETLTRLPCAEPTKNASFVPKDGSIHPPRDVRPKCSCPCLFLLEILGGVYGMFFALQGVKKTTWELRRRKAASFFHRKPRSIGRFRKSSFQSALLEKVPSFVGLDPTGSTRAVQRCIKSKLTTSLTALLKMQLPHEHVGDIVAPFIGVPGHCDKLAL